jgi:hypothetical protein
MGASFMETARRERCGLLSTGVEGAVSHEEPAAKTEGVSLGS